MLHKIRLHGAGTVRADFHANLGSGFDGHYGDGELRAVYVEGAARTSVSSHFLARKLKSEN
jgi:hypothetical protein